MPKRKRDDLGLEENLTKWRKKLAHGLYLAKCFERQRLSKRLREADDVEKKGRLEKEILVLKSLDLQQAAYTHLCSSLLKIKRIAESPKLPAEIKPIPKHELSEDERVALHNVTSALYSRKQVKNVIDEAIKGTCIALDIPVPEKGGKGKGSEKKVVVKASIVQKEERLEVSHDDGDDSSADDESQDVEEPTFKGPRLLKRKVEEGDSEEDLESDADDPDASSSSGFQGFSDSDAEEKMFSKYDDLVGGSSDEDDFGEEDDEEDEDDESDQIESRSRSLQKLALDDISLSSAASDDSTDSEDDTLLPPSKKAKVRAVKPVSFNATSSTFLPSLMGGYVSGSESASDIDIAPSRKNRRGQRARQAIWDKKYGEKAKHLQKENDSRNSGWDMKRGAVDDGGSSGPWKKGIRDPFQKNHVHPERQRQMQRQTKGKRDMDGRQDNRDRGFRAEEPPKPKPQRARDDTGPLHPSWAAAKKAKEGGQKVAFQGKKVTFDSEN